MVATATATARIGPVQIRSGLGPVRVLTGPDRILIGPVLGPSLGIFSVVGPAGPVQSGSVLDR